MDDGLAGVEAAGHHYQAVVDHLYLRDGPVVILLDCPDELSHLDGYGWSVTLAALYCHVMISSGGVNERGGGMV